MNIDSIKTDMKDIHQRLVNKIFIEKCLEEFVDLTYQYDIDIKLLKNDRDKKERQDKYTRDSELIRLKSLTYVSDLKFPPMTNEIFNHYIDRQCQHIRELSVGLETITIELVVVDDSNKIFYAKLNNTYFPISEFDGSKILEFHHKNDLFWPINHPFENKHVIPILSNIIYNNISKDDLSNFIKNLFNTNKEIIQCLSLYNKHLSNLPVYYHLNTYNSNLFPV